MSKVYLKDVVTRIKDRVDKDNTHLEFYIGGEHFDNGEIQITRRGLIAGSTIGPAFHMRFAPGDVLLMSRNPHLRKAGVVDFEGICSDVSYVCRTKDENILMQRFLPFIFQSDDFWKFAEENKKGSTNFFLNWSDFEKYEFTLPSIEIQRKLVEILWSFEDTKTAYKKLLKKTDELVKSQFIEMFGDQNTNDKVWSESLVKDEFKLSMGKTPARNNPECWDNGNHKWVSISDMSSYARYTGDTSEYITDYAIADSGIKPVPKGTIIMSFKLSIGRTAITSEDIYTNEAIMAFADFDEKKFNIDFLHFLIANKNWLLGAKQAVKGQTLNKESIGNAKIIIPPIEMQEQFASIYNQADKSKFELRKSINAIDAVIKSLING